MRGLRTKTEDLYLSVLCCDYDVIILTETWLNDTIFDHELFDTRYAVFRRDRSTTSSYLKDGGGVVIAIHKKFESLRKKSWESVCEDLWVSFKIGQSTQINICGVYIPPPVKELELNYFLKNTAQVINSNTDDGTINVVIGDFNLSNIVWEYSTYSRSLIPVRTNNNVDSLFIDTIFFCNLHQCNSISNYNERILDLVLSSHPSFLTVSEEKPLVPLDCHHPALLIDLQYSTQKHYLKSNTEPKYNFAFCDYNTVIEELSNIDWAHLWKNCSSVDEMIEVFYETLLNVIYKNTPKSKPRDGKHPIWYSRSLIRTLKEKSKYHKVFKKYKNPMDKYTYDLLRDRSNEMIFECYDFFKKNISDHIRNNPKYFWIYFKDRNCNSKSIPNQMILNDRKATGGQEICNLFSYNFQSIYDTTHKLPPFNPKYLTSIKCTNNTYAKCSVTDHEVKTQLLSLNCNKGAGPDLIPPIFIKNCAKVLVNPLTTIYNKSLQSGIFPAKWKVAYITPIHKSGDINNISNYRPISILSTFGKVFESLIQKKMYSHLKPYFDSHQHGFCPHKSTTSNLVSYITDISEAVDKNNEVHAIYLDFKKAFDLVHHDILLTKLECMGIHGSLLRWCESYLKNRSQLVAINGFKSFECKIPSGVPQGSHLGPLFFLVFINDVGKVLKSKYQIFADDLKIYREIKSPEDIEILQSDIDNLVCWCLANRMTLNKDKCVHIKFSRKRKPLKHTYYIDGTPLTESTSVRDLGVIIDNTLSFRDHIDSIISKASQVSGLVLRLMKIFKDPSLTILVYNSIIRSILEYCSVAWSPGYEVHSDRIERVQKRFLYYLAYTDLNAKNFNSYDARLINYKVQTLKYRREAADFLFLYKLLHGYIDAPDLLAKISFYIPRQGSRLQKRKIFSLPDVKSNLGQHSPIYRICSLANCSRQHLDVFSESVGSLKNKLKTKSHYFM